MDKFFEVVLKEKVIPHSDECGKWISLGHRSGLFKHPYSVDFKCPFCGYEEYSVPMLWIPENCMRCGAKLEAPND